MASSKDVRDIMGFAAGGAQPQPKKKAPKPFAGKKLTGISREVVALHGDRAPPISIVESSKTYRKGLDRDRKFKPSPWSLVEFENSARGDGLVLKHWRKTGGMNAAATLGTNSNTDSDAMEVDSSAVSETTPSRQPAEYEYAKYNIEITVPSYTDEQYDKFLKDPEWSREETDYLLELVKDYYQKWAVIADRYDWHPQDTTVTKTEDSTAVARLSDVPQRDLESLKARYYYICARAMEFSLPNGVADMNTEEFALHDQYSKYKPDLERTRKNMTWALCRRNPDEVREEEFLLSELQRIMISAQKFETERAELRQRLEYAQPLNGGTGSLVLSSQALTQLYNQLVQQDRNRKPRAKISLDALQSPATAGQGLATPASAGGHRDSIGGSGTKKGSATAPVPARQLSAKQEARFGVTTHDRLTSGVTFRTDRLLKLRQAKSQIQTQKINQALAHLDIPDLLPLPTTRVVETFEGLIQKINLLLDARKVLAKEENELQTAMQIKADLQRKETEMKEEIVVGGANAQPEADADADADGDADADADADGEDVDMLSPVKEVEAEPARPSSSRSNAAASHKRSASVLSAASSRGSRRKK